MELSEPWIEALDLAWAAMTVGTTPVGSVVINGDGQIVTRVAVGDTSATRCPVSCPTATSPTRS